jgi:hypothetical protein
VIGSEIDKMASELSAIISKQILRGASFTNQAVQNFHHMLASKLLPHLDRQCFATEYVDYGQRPELLAMAGNAWPCETRTSTCRSFVTISSDLCLFLGISVLFDAKRHT